MKTLTDTEQALLKLWDAYNSETILSSDNYTSIQVEIDKINNEGHENS